MTVLRGLSPSFSLSPLWLYTAGGRQRGLAPPFCSKTLNNNDDNADGNWPAPLWQQIQAKQPWRSWASRKHSIIWVEMKCRLSQTAQSLDNRSQDSLRIEAKTGDSKGGFFGGWVNGWVGWWVLNFTPEFSRGGILGIKRFMKEGRGGDWRKRWRQGRRKG